VSSLDVLDYQVALDEALAKRGPDGRPLLEAAHRKQAMREVRRLVEAMAFRHALLDDRALPEDLDYLRALEGLKPAEKAAEVFARKRPVYVRARRRRLLTTWISLAVVALAVAALAYGATSEKAERVVDVSTSQTTNATFHVDGNVTRLHVDGTILPARGSEGTIDIFLYSPSGKVYTLWPDGDRRDNYLRRNLDGSQIEVGDWRVLVDLNGGPGSVSLVIDAVRPAR
jgi:hypothetical protein